jgi:hypothetical protein
VNCSFCVTDESRDTTNDLVGRHHWLGHAYCQTCIAVTPFKIELLPVTTALGALHLTYAGAEAMSGGKWRPSTSLKMGRHSRV